MGKVAVTGACVWTEREGGSNEEPGENGDSRFWNRWREMEPGRHSQKGQGSCGYTEIFQVGGDELS